VNADCSDGTTGAEVEKGGCAKYGLKIATESRGADTVCDTAAKNALMNWKRNLIKLNRIL
jgi:hypothetical protein